MKTCSKCRATKLLEAFSRDSRTSDGKKSYCKVCQAAYRASYYAEHRDNELARSNAYNTNNSEKRYAYYLSTREERVPYFAEYRSTHSEERAAYGAMYRINHREELATATAARRAKAKLSKEDRIESTAHRKRIKNDRCYYCEQWSSEMHDDHVIPLSRGGTDHWWNIVRACSTCNLRKGAKTDLEYTATMPYREGR